MANFDHSEQQDSKAQGAPATEWPKPPAYAGLLGRCPRCGAGNLFAGPLTIAPRCEVCGLDFGFADSADGPAVFVMLIMGFVAVGLALTIEAVWEPRAWVHAVVTLPLCAALCLGALRVFKGLLVFLQYRMRAGEGRVAK